MSVEAVAAEVVGDRRAGVRDGEEWKGEAGRAGDGEHFGDEEKASSRRVAVRPWECGV